MNVYAALFWSFTIVSLWLCGNAYINGSIQQHYLLMATLGDSMFALRTGAIVIPIVVALAVSILWLWRRPLAPGWYIIGLVPLGLAACLTFLPPVDSGYKQTYWLEDQRHSIPWVYGPYNGQSVPGGDYFLIRVRGAELLPYYKNSNQSEGHFTLQKATAFNYGKGGPPPENNCIANGYNFRCEWQEGDYVYALSTDADSAPADPQSFFRPVEKLLNSFEVDVE